MPRLHVNLHRAAKGLPRFAETKGGRVQAYHETATLTGARVTVSASKLREARKRGCRQVCFWLDGERGPAPESVDGWARLSFHPVRDDLPLADGRPFTSAAAVHMTPAGVFVLHPEA